MKQLKCDQVRITQNEPRFAKEPNSKTTLFSYMTYHHNINTGKKKRVSITVPSNSSSSSSSNSKSNQFIRIRLRLKKRKGSRSRGVRGLSGGPRSRWWDRAWRWVRHRGWRWWGSWWCSKATPSLPISETDQLVVGACWRGNPWVSPRDPGCSTCSTLLSRRRRVCAEMRGAAAGSCYSWLLLGMAFVRFWCLCVEWTSTERESERERVVAHWLWFVWLSVGVSWRKFGLSWPNWYFTELDLIPKDQFSTTHFDTINATTCSYGELWLVEEYFYINPFSFL